MRTKTWKRGISLLLCMAMLLGNLPGVSFAAENDGLCEHHTEHTDCGYAEGLSACGYACQLCLQTPAETTEPEETTAPAETAEPELACTGLADCAAESHGDGCEKKLAEEKSAADREAADDVAAMIDALPSLEEIQTKPLEEQSADYNQVQAAYDAYAKLTENQKALLPETEDVFGAYFDYFNGLTVPVTTSGTCGDDLSWEFDDTTGLLTITGSGAMLDYGEDAPWYSFRSQIKSIVMESGITHIGGCAFMDCSSLIDVTIPASVETIEGIAFSGCTNLETLDIPDGVISIGSVAFNGCENLTTVTIADSVTTIYAGAFQGCSSLTSVTLSENLAELSNFIFSGCSSLSGIVIPKSVAALGNRVFGSCTALTEIRFAGNAPTFSDDVFTGVTAKVYYPADDSSWTSDVMQQYGGEITWAAYETVVTGTCGTGLTWTYDEVSHILTISGSGAMDNYADVNDSGEFNMPWADYLSDVEKIVVEEGVTAVGNNAFFGSNATEVELPEGLISIGDYAFGLNTELPEITIPASVTSIGSSAFFACIISEIILPDGLTYLGDNAFSGCENLKAIDIPASLTEISGWTFTHAGLTSITIPGTVRSIGESAFQHCHLENVTIEEGVTSIGDWAFYWTDLTEVTLPETITSVGMGAFCDTRLTSIRIPASVTSIGPGAFDCDSLLNIEVDDTSSSYMNDAAGVLYNKDQTTLTACPGGYRGTYSIPNTVTRIEDRAFIGCTGLTQITIPEGVTYIGEMAFATCQGLMEVVIPEGVTTLGEAAFDGCSALADIIIPESVTALPGHVFGNTALTSYRIPDSITSIGEYAFSMCHELTEITIPNSVTYMGDCTFYHCSNLEKVVFEGSAPEFGKGARPSRGMFSGVTATVYYPADDTTWTEDVKQDYDGTITWVAVDAAENRITVTSADLKDQTSVWIDGVEYAVQTDGGVSYIDLPDGNAETMVAYTYHAEDSSDVHTQYPTGMQVWTLSNEDGRYTATRVEELDDILQYAGSSIRATGKKGIRMITAIDLANKNALIGSGLAGYRLKEYGTVVALAEKLDEANPLVLGKSYAKSNYAYKKGTADAVLAYRDGCMQYTNVLVNFSNAQCAQDIAMRPYMILADAAGNEITLYGGTVERSIGYIAYQNRNAFVPGTEAYAYIWEIIHAVYGDAYDEEYQGA